MAGLFSTPLQVREEERAQGAATANSANPLAGSLFNLGSDISKMSIRGLSQKYDGAALDTRSEREIQAGEMQDMMRGIDFSDRASVFGKARALNDAGYSQEAAEVLKLLPAIPEQFDWRKSERALDLATAAGSRGGFLGEPFEQKYTDPVTGDTSWRKMVLVEDKNGKPSIVEFNSLTSRPDQDDDDSSLGDDKFTPMKEVESFKKQVKYSDKFSKTTVMANIAATPGYSTLFDKIDEAETEVAVGNIQHIANLLKREDREASSKFMKGLRADDTLTQSQRIEKDNLEGPKDRGDETYLDDAMKLYLDGGGMSKAMDKNSAQFVSFDTTLRPTLEELRDNREQSKQLKQAQAEMEQHRQGAIVGVGSGDFRLDNLSSEQAQTAFGQIGQTDNETIHKMIDKGKLSFNIKGSKAWHESQWNLARSTPENQMFTAELMALEPGTVPFTDYISDKLHEALDNGKVNQWLQYQKLGWYLSRLDTTGQDQRNIRSSVGNRTDAETATLLKSRGNVLSNFDDMGNFKGK